MKKRLVTVILALALILSTGMTVFAGGGMGGSPGVEGGPAKTSIPLPPPIECYEDCE